MTLLLLILIYSKDVIIQFFAVMPCDVPVFEKHFQKLDKLLGFAWIDVNNQIHICFHVGTDVTQLTKVFKRFMQIRGNFILNPFHFFRQASVMDSPEVPNHSLQAAAGQRSSRPWTSIQNSTSF